MAKTRKSEILHKSIKVGPNILTPLCTSSILYSCSFSFASFYLDFSFFFRPVLDSIVLLIFAYSICSFPWHNHKDQIFCPVLWFSQLIQLAKMQNICFCTLPQASPSSSPIRRLYLIMFWWLFGSRQLLHWRMGWKMAESKEFASRKTKGNSLVF